MSKVKGQVEDPSWVLGPIIVIGLFSLGAFLTIQSYSKTSLDVQSASSKIQVENMENKLISSSDCLSTGDIGVINKSRLDEFESKGNILEKCRPVPSINYKIKVKDLSSNEKWVLGDPYINDSPESEMSISLKSKSGTSPGKMWFYFSTLQENLLLSFRKHIASAWAQGKSETIVSLNRDRKIKIGGGEIKDKETGKTIDIKIPGKEDPIKVSNRIDATLPKNKQILLKFKESNGKIDINIRSL